jgi:hypothetical protein
MPLSDVDDVIETLEQKRASHYYWQTDRCPVCRVDVEKSQRLIHEAWHDELLGIGAEIDESTFKIGSARIAAGYTPATLFASEPTQEGLDAARR